MKKNHLLAFLTLFMGNCMANEVIVAANQLISESFEKWTVGKSCLQINNFDSPYANRGTIELILSCKALHAGGYSGKTIVKEYPNYTGQ